MANIVLVRKNVKNSLSAVPKTVIAQARRLRESGHGVTVIAEDINQKWIRKAGATPVKTMKWPLRGYMRRKWFQLMVQYHIRRLQPDLIVGRGDILHQDILSMDNCVHLAHECIYGTPLPAKDAAGKIHTEIFKQGGFKLLICNSKLMQEDFAHRFQVDPKRTAIIYPGLDPDYFQMETAPQARATFRKQYALAENVLLIGLITSGAFTIRNVAGMLKAYALTRLRHHNSKLLVAGKDKTAPYRKLAADLGISEHVIFAPAIQDVQNYYHMIDLFVLPGFIETFGKSVSEAMYCQKPVIVGPNVGAKEILEGPSAACVLPDITPEAIAAQVNTMLESEDLRNQCACSNRQTAQKYTTTKEADIFYTMLTERGFLPAP